MADASGKKTKKMPPHENILMPPHIAHICLCLPTQKANPKAKAKECNRQRTKKPFNI
jgi:hypothetical protein